jgi:hypothetical protein
MKEAGVETVYSRKATGSLAAKPLINVIITCQ